MLVLWYRLALWWEDRAWHLVDWLAEERLPNGLYQRFVRHTWPFYDLPLLPHLLALRLSRRYRAFVLVTGYHRRRLHYLAWLPRESRRGVYPGTCGVDGEVGT